MATRVIVLIALCFVSRVAAAQTPGLPVVRVVGPLPVSAASYPFGAADHTRVPEDLKKVGYVEEEFLASGVADVYDWTSCRPGTGQDRGRALHHARVDPAAGRPRAFQRHRNSGAAQPVEPV